MSVWRMLTEVEGKWRAEIRYNDFIVLHEKNEPFEQQETIHFVKNLAALNSQVEHEFTQASRTRERKNILLRTTERV